MKRAHSTLLLLASLACGTLVAEQTARQLVEEHIAFFEHLFATVASTSGVHQRSYLDHLGLSEAQGQVVVKIAGQFQSQENTLRRQAEMALSEKRSDMDSRLAQLRSQRAQLLLQTAMQIIQELGTDGSSRIKEYVQRVAAAIPKRTSN